MLGDRPVAALAVGQTVVWAGIYYSFPALLLRWEADLGWPKTQLTGAITLAILLSALAAPFAGRIIDRGRGPQLMAASAALGGMALLALAGIDRLWQFYLVWAVLGLAMAGSLYEPCFALVTRARGARARGAIVRITLVAGFAGTISFPFAHAVSEAAGWRAAVSSMGAAVLIVGVPFLWAGARGLDGQAQAAGGPAPAATMPRRARGPVFWPLALAFGSIALLQGIVIHHLLPILDDRGVSPQHAVLAAAGIGPMQVAGRLAMAAGERLVTVHAVAIGCFACLAAAIAVLLSAGSGLVMLGLFVSLFGGAYGTVSILRPLITRELLGAENFGATSGAMARVYLLGIASGPWLASLVWSAGGYGLVLGGLLALSGIGCALYLTARAISARYARLG